MTKRNWLTDEEVDKEIEELKKSPHVRLAREDSSLRVRESRWTQSMRCSIALMRT